MFLHHACLSPNTSSTCGCAARAARAAESELAQASFGQAQIEAECEEVFDELIHSIIELCKVDSVEAEPTDTAPYGEGCLKALQKALSISEALGFATDTFQNMV